MKVFIFYSYFSVNCHKIYGLQNNNMGNSEQRSINLKPAWHINENAEYVLKDNFFLSKNMLWVMYIFVYVAVVEMMRGAL